VTRFRRRGDEIRWDLEGFEADLLRRLRDGLHRTLLDHTGDDPVVARLFPAAVADDPVADDELRRLLHDDLLRSKLDGLDALVAIIDRAESRGDRLRVALRDDEPLLVLGVLNDLRLAIGARIGIDRLERDEVPEDAPERTSLAIMDHLAWMQEQILAIVDPVSVTGPEDV
jgi:hypothetical protein